MECRQHTFWVQATAAAGSKAATASRLHGMKLRLAKARNCAPKAWCASPHRRP